MIIRIWMTMALFFLLLSPSVHAAEQSSDPMVLEWTTTRVWISKGELCAAGQFVNHRDQCVHDGDYISPCRRVIRYVCRQSKAAPPVQDSGGRDAAGDAELWPF